MGFADEGWQKTGGGAGGFMEVSGKIALYRAILFEEERSGSEVTSLFKTSRRYYRLSRAERKPLSFGYPLENVEGLADLVRQYIKK